MVPECVALFTHGSGGKFFGDLLNAFGSDQYYSPVICQCRGPREVAFMSTFGEVVASPERTDIRDTKCLVLIGSHIGENMHNGQVQEMSDAIDKGATIITVDPRFSTAASKSKYWLPIKPATDLALLLAWTHEIIYNEWYDRKYVEKYCYGFDELKEHVKSFTPEWAYGITTIKPHIIRETAKEMANASPAVMYIPEGTSPGMEMIHNGSAQWRSSMHYSDHGEEEEDFTIQTGPPSGSFPHPEFPEPKKTWRDAHPGLYNLANEVVANKVCDATIPSPDRACNFKGWIVNGTNLIFTLPDQKKPGSYPKS
jgi:thiosulfate reductase / polysulfide reductase chain A